MRFELIVVFRLEISELKLRSFLFGLWHIWFRVFQFTILRLLISRNMLGSNFNWNLILRFVIGFRGDLSWISKLVLKKYQFEISFHEMMDRIKRRLKLAKDEMLMYGKNFKFFQIVFNKFLSLVCWVLLYVLVCLLSECWIKNVDSGYISMLFCLLSHKEIYAFLCWPMWLWSHEPLFFLLVLLCLVWLQNVCAFIYCI